MKHRILRPLAVEKRVPAFGWPAANALFRASLVVGSVLGIMVPVVAAPRTFVASYGIDSNPCTIAVPCRSFNAAIALTDSGGEVIVLDAAGYGAFTTTQSVSVIAPAGVYAGISVFSADGVTVDGPGIRIVLRGLNINGLGGRDGIQFPNGASLDVVDCRISNMDRNGLGQTSAGTLYMTGTEIRGGTFGIQLQNGTAVMDRVTILSSGQFGLYFAPFLNTHIRATLTNSSVRGSLVAGVVLAASSNRSAAVTVERSTAEGNGEYGLLAVTGGGLSTLTVSRSLVADHQKGISADGSGAVTVVTESTVVRNGIGLHQSQDGVLRSLGNNTVEANGAASEGTITNVSLQ